MSDIVHGHVDVGMCPYKVLAATLTLFQPGGPHQVLKATGAPEVHKCWPAIPSLKCILTTHRDVNELRNKKQTI